MDMDEMKLDNFTEDENYSEAQEYLQMGQVLLGTEKYEDAILLIEKSLELEPMNKTAYVTKGIAHASLEDYEQARECFKSAIKIDKKYADAYFQMGNIEFLEDHFQEGMADYNQAIACGYKDAALYYNLALVYEEQDNAEEAIRNYTKAFTLDGTNPEYLIRKASLQIIVMKYEEALQTLEKVRTLFPDSFEGYHLTAAAYTLMEKYDEADIVLKNALELFPDDMDILFDRLRVLTTKGEVENALQLLLAAKDKEATPSQMKEILLNEAKLKGQMDKLDETVSLLKEAAEIAEGEHLDSEIRYLLVNALHIQKDFLSMYEVAKQIDKNDTTDPYKLSGMYYECIAIKGKGDEGYKESFKNAIRYYRNISLKDPARVDAFLFRAMCHREIEEYDKALECVDYVLLLQPENAQLHQIRGNILTDQGKVTEAKAEYSEAKRLGLRYNFLEMTGGI